VVVTGSLTLLTDMECTSFATSGTGAVDFGTFDVDCGGNFTLASSGVVDLGETNTVTIAGNLSWASHTGTLTGGSSEVVMTGTSKTVAGVAAKALYDLTIDGTVSATERIPVSNALTINAAKSLTLNILFAALDNSTIQIDGSLICSSLSIAAGCAITVAAAGSVTGAGLLTCTDCSVDNSAGGTWDVVGTAFQGDTTIAGGTFSCATIMSIQQSGSDPNTCQITGATTFAEDLLIDADGGTGATITVDVDAPLTFNKNLDITEPTNTVVWDNASGSLIKFVNSTYNDATAAEPQNLGPVAVDGTGLTLASGMACTTFTGTSGTLATAGEAVTATGNFAAAANFAVTGAGLVTVGGTFDLNGTDGNPVTWTDADLAVTGAATAHWTVVTDSDASGGTQIDATDNCTNIGTNDNWKFVSFLSCWADYVTTYIGMGA